MLFDGTIIRLIIRFFYIAFYSLIFLLKYNYKIIKVYINYIKMYNYEVIKYYKNIIHQSLILIGVFYFIYPYYNYFKLII